MALKGIGKRVKSPLRVFKVFTPKSKSKNGLGSNASQASLAQKFQEAAAASQPTLAAVVLENKVADEVQQQVEEEQTRAPVEAAPEARAEGATIERDNKTQEATVANDEQVKALESESSPAKSDTVDHTRHSVVSSSPTVVEEHVEENMEKAKETPQFVRFESHDIKIVTGPRDSSQPESKSESRPAVHVVELDDAPDTAAVNKDNGTDLALASSLTTVDLSVSDIKEAKMDVPHTQDQDEAAVTAQHPTQSPSPPAGEANPESEPPASIADPVADINPFIVDDPDAPLSDDEAASSSPSAKTTAPAGDKIVVSHSLSSPPGGATVLSDAPAKDSLSTHPHGTSTDLTPVPIDVTKDVNPTPAPAPSTSPSSDTSEDEAPELHTPALVLPTLFLPVPNTDPLTTLLIKHVPEPHLRPPRDLSGEWQHSDFHTLVMTNNWRSLARMARDRIVSTNPSEIELILNLWYIRLSSLARLRLFNQTSAECENLFGVLANIEPPSARAYVFSNVLPFELEVMRARCAYWGGDHIGYLDDLSALLRRCRAKARKAKDQGEAAMWKERGARMCLIIASQLIEMRDFTAATSLLEPLLSSSPQSSALRSAIARIYLQGGYVQMAAHHFALVDADPEADQAQKDANMIILSAADGDWETAVERARYLLEKEPENVVAINNCAVSLLSLGKLKDAIQILESILQSSPSAVTTAEPYLFNLSTLYELRSALTLNRKRDLLIEVAKWSGDGLRATCLKLG